MQVLCFLVLLPFAFAKLIALPPSIQAEGVTKAKGSNVFFTNLRTGAVHLMDVNSNLLTTVVPPGEKLRGALGLDFYANRIFVAGGGLNVAPAVHVFDAITGKTVVSCKVKKNGFVNDVKVVNGVAYFTDSFEGVVYTMYLKDIPTCKVGTITLPRPAFKPEVGVFRANGIVEYKGGLIVSNSKLGTVFFIDLKKGARPQKLVPDGTLKGCDGLEIEKKKKKSILYVAQNRLGLVSAWSLEIDGRNRWINMKKKKVIKSNAFDGFPTTISLLDNGKLVSANPKFNIVSGSQPIPEGTTFSLGVTKA